LGLAFLGQYEYTLDAKNRLTIPPKFRGTLSDGVVLARELEPCISIRPAQAWRQFTDQAIASRDPFSKEARDLKRYFSGYAFDGQLDSAGRVILPAPLIEYAGIGKEITVIGSLDSIEVWDRKRWGDYAPRLSEEAPDLASRLSKEGSG
jgi:MraZ protein